MHEIILKIVHPQYRMNFMLDFSEIFFVEYITYILCDIHLKFIYNFLGLLSVLMKQVPLLSLTIEIINACIQLLVVFIIQDHTNAISFYHRSIILMCYILLKHLDINPVIHLFCNISWLALQSGKVKWPFNWNKGQAQVDEQLTGWCVIINILSWHWYSFGVCWWKF